MREKLNPKKMKYKSKKESKKEKRSTQSLVNRVAVMCILFFSFYFVSFRFWSFVHNIGRKKKDKNAVLWSCRSSSSSKQNGEHIMHVRCRYCVLFLFFFLLSMLPLSCCVNSLECVHHACYFVANVLTLRDRAQINSERRFWNRQTHRRQHLKKLWNAVFTHQHIYTQQYWTTPKYLNFCWKHVNRSFHSNTNR